MGDLIARRGKFEIATGAKDIHERNSLVCEQADLLVQRQFISSGRFKVKNLEGEGPPEPVRLRTTDMVADFGSGFIPFAWSREDCSARRQD